MTDLFSLEHFREVNTMLGFATICGLLYRTPEALLGVSSKRLYVVLALFPVGVSLAGLYALARGLSASNPFAIYFTVLFIALGLVETVYWPFNKPRPK